MQVNSSLPLALTPGINRAASRLKGTRVKALGAPAEQETSGNSQVFELNPNVEFIAAGEEPNFQQAGFTAQAKKALQGYWQVAHQSFSAPRYVDVYV